MNLNFFKNKIIYTKYVYEFLNVDASEIIMSHVAMVWSFKVQLDITFIRFFDDLNVH